MLLKLKIFQFLMIQCTLDIILDFYSIFLSLVIIIITLSVILFSSSYMTSELNKSRFYKLILGFVISMLVLVFSFNMMTLIIGWDGLGLLSFLLVIFYQNEKSLGSGLITMLSNRLGDGFLLMLMAMMCYTMNFNFYCNISLLMMMILMLGSMTKSAQVPFSSWLPRAMAAPTPISALVHSSTLVTAGVFLLIRFSENLNLSWLLLLGAFTTFLSGLAGMAEHDSKKIIALSTLSQLGVMFMSLGLNLSNVTFFHLCTHAFYKAMIFICCGEMIVLLQGNQDIRFYGNLFKMNPMLSMCLITGLMALSGLPFLSGFYSKDAMLEQFSVMNFNVIIILLGWLGVFMTSFYSMRMMIMSLWKTSFNPMIMNVKNMTTLYSVLILNLSAICLGSVLSYFSNLTPIFTLMFMKLLPFIMFFLGIMFGLNYWFLEFKNSMISSLGFLNFLTQFLTKPQKFFYNVIMINESGWLESVPKNIFIYIKYFKKSNLFFSVLSLMVLFLF